MRISNWNGRQLSQLMLGTVQFGMPYGVANQTGQPSYDQVVSIVAAAVEGGVNCFDTAAMYGNSEEVIGRVLRELGIANEVTVVTKVRALDPVERSDAKLASAAIEQSIDQSRKRLQLDCLPVVLFHREPDAAHSDVLCDLRERGWIGALGVSCDNPPGPACKFATSGHFSALQIPSNILDRRHLRSGVFGEAKTHDVALFIRSVYLQGLLLMPEQAIPEGLKDVIPARRKLDAITHDAGLTMSELAVRYMLSQSGVTCVITGVETVEQVKENVAIFERGPLTSDLLAEIDRTTPELSERILTPGLWPPRT